MSILKKKSKKGIHVARAPFVISLQDKYLFEPPAHYV
jgi:hypothetical protein